MDVLYSTGVQSSDVMAFSATYDFGFLETRLEANLSLGLLVIANLNTFRDGSGRSNYFSREFFYHSKGSPEQLANVATRMESMRAMRFEDKPDIEGSLPPGSIDPSPFLGDWLSTNGNTRGIARLVISGDDDGLIIQGFGGGDPPFCDWGDAAVAFCRRGYVEARLAFSAVYDSDLRRPVCRQK